MGFIFAFLPLIVFLIVRAKMSQAEAQTPQTPPVRPQTPPERPPVRPQTPPERPPVRPQTPPERPPVRSQAPAQRPIRQARPERVWVSPEGTASDEGECVEENPQHCAVEHSEEPAYALDSAANLPREELARAVVVSEILGKPVSLRADRF